MGEELELNIINAHALCEENDQIIKVEFYEGLANILEKTLRFDIKFILGDMNASILSVATMEREQQRRNNTKIVSTLMTRIYTKKHKYLQTKTQETKFITS